MEPATKPIYSNGPSKKLILLIGALIGGFVGVFFALSIEVLQRRIDRPEDVEKHLGVPVLASIQHVGRRAK